MGSGLILVLIVGAWLAVLVPMALRSHDASALGTVDRFSDAMRVLSRREPVGRGGAAPEGAPESDAGPQDERDEDGHPSGPADSRWTRLRAVLARPGRATWRRLSGVRRRRARRAPLRPAARRLRALLVLLAAAGGTLVGAVLGPLWMVVPHVVVDVLLVVFLCWLRASAVARAERDWRIAMGGRPTTEVDAGPILPAEVGGSALPGHVAGIPSRMPTRSSLDPRPQRLVPVPRGAEAPARGASGEPWRPVPLPAPTYLSAPPAPRRRIIDLTATGSPAAGADGASSDRAWDLEQAVGRRRAVGD